MNKNVITSTVLFALMAFAAPQAHGANKCESGTLTSVELFAGNPGFDGDPKKRPSSGQSIVTPKHDDNFIAPRWGGPTTVYEEKGEKYFVFSDDRMTYVVPVNPKNENYKKMFRIVGQAEKTFVHFGKCNDGKTSARFIGSPYMAQTKDKDGKLKNELLVSDPYGNFVALLKNPLDADKCELKHVAGNSKNNSVVVNGRPPHRGNTKGEGGKKVCGKDVQFWNVAFITPDLKDSTHKRYYVFDHQGAKSKDSDLSVLDIETGCVERLVKKFPVCHVTSMVMSDKTGELYLTCNHTGGESWVYAVDPKKDKEPRKLFTGGSKFWVGDSKQPLLQGSHAAGKYLYLSGNGYIYRIDITAKGGTFGKKAEPEKIAGVGATTKYHAWFKSNKDYDFYGKHDAKKAAFPYNQGDGPVYNGVFSRFFAGPDNDNLFYCGRYKYASACWKIGCK